MPRKYNNRKKTPGGKRKSIHIRLKHTRESKSGPKVINHHPDNEGNIVEGNVPEISAEMGYFEDVAENSVRCSSEGNLEESVIYDETTEQTGQLDKVQEGNQQQGTVEEQDVYNLSGRRIVNIQHFFNELTKFKHVDLFSCNNDSLKIINEVRQGFISKFIVKCETCMEVKNIVSEKSECSMDINKAVILGTIATGGSYAQMQENYSYCDIPIMSNHTFLKIQESLADTIHDIAWEVIEQAGIEEKNIAIEKGHVDEDGIPYITVIADGAWSKRSYKVNYDAASGVGVIVGQATKKVLFVGIRNKYCCVCSRAATKNIEPAQHACFRNWDKPSTSMESDIIVEGFLKSIPLHGLKYAFLVGDGDSSVIKKLTDIRPYHNRVVQKIECRNHLLRNYCSRLRELTQKRISSKKEMVSVKERNVLNNSIRRLRCGIVTAVKHVNEHFTNIEHTGKINALKQDICNAPYHVFGNHSNCAKYFCNGPKSKTEVDWTITMKKSGLLQDIICISERIVRNAESLLLNMDNNAAEQYNAILAKFVGGKRINFTMRRSYQTRCEAAAITYNVKTGQLPRMVHNKISRYSPGRYTSKYISSKCAQRNWRNVRKKLFPQSFNKKAIPPAPPDEDYGLPSIQMSSVEYDKEKEAFLKSLYKTDEEIHSLENNTIGQSTTLLWKEERSKRITASVFGKICKLRKTTHCAATIKSMLYTTFQGNFYTSWGLEHEGVAIAEYEERQRIKIQECGLFIDTEIPYLGASPDGLLGENGIVEIKCPQSAASYTPLEAIKNKKITYATIESGNIHLKQSHNYYYQIQGQLHVTKRRYCVFVIWTPLGLESEIIYRDDQFWDDKMATQLKDFYFKCLLPEIINPQYTHHLPIKDFRFKDPV